MFRWFSRRNAAVVLFPNDSAEGFGVFDDFFLGHVGEHVVQNFMAEDFESVASAQTAVNLDYALLPAKAISAVISQLSFDDLRKFWFSFGWHGRRG